MLRYLAQRIVLLGLTFVAITIVAFAIIHLAPGDPVDLFFAGGLGAGAEGVNAERLAEVAQAKEQLRAELGLDRPLHEQYAKSVGAKKPDRQADRHTEQNGTTICHTDSVCIVSPDCCQL